jgi:hypothetical protein
LIPAAVVQNIPGMGSGRMDRRIGARRPVAPVEVQWTTRHFGRRGALRARAAYTQRSSGRLLDLSVSGARIEGLKFVHLRRDVPAVVTVAGMAARVRMRRWETTRHPDRLCYGVEFVDLDDEFRDRLFEFIGDRRPYAVG